MTQSKPMKRMARAMQRLTGASYSHCFRQIREHGSTPIILAEVARWKSLTPEQRKAEKEGAA